MRRAMIGLWLATVLMTPLGCGGKPAPDKPDGKDATPKSAAKTGRDDAGKLAPGAGTAKALDLSYVAPDFFAAAIVSPQRIIASTALKGLPLDAMIEEIQKNIGVDPREVEQAIVLVEPPQGGPPPEPSVVLRFAGPYRAKDVLDRAWSKRGKAAEESTREGKPYFRGPAGMAAWAPDDRTLLVSNEAMLQKMMAAREAKGPLVDRLRAADAKAELVVAVVMDPVRETARQMAEAAGRRAPAPLKAAMGASEDLAAATFFVHLDGPVTATAVLEGKDADAAGQIESLAQGLVAAAKMLIEDNRAEIAKAQPSAAKAAAIAEDLLAKTTVAKSGTLVTLELKRPKAMDDLAGAVMPLVLEAQNAAESATRQNGLKQIILAMQNYMTSERGFPAAAIRDKAGKPLLSWRVAILPYIESEDLYKQFHLDEPWDSEHNKALLEKMPEVYRSTGVKTPGMTTMMVFTGEGTPFGGEKGIGFEDIKDGSSNTLAVVQAGPDKAVPWTKPEDLVFEKDNPIAALGNLTGRYFFGAMCDGSVHRFPKDVDPETLRRLIQHADGQVVDPNALR